MICVNQNYSRRFAKCIIWPKKLGKGRQEWEKAYVNSNPSPKEIEYFGEDKVILFF
jgi:hypothetical protein